MDPLVAIAALSAASGLTAVGVTVYHAKVGKTKTVQEAKSAAAQAVDLSVQTVLSTIKLLKEEAAERDARIAELGDVVRAGDARNAETAKALQAQVAETQEALGISRECRRRIMHMADAIRSLGGVVEDSGDVEDQGDHHA